MSKWKHCHRWCKRRAVLVPGPTKNHNGVIPPLTRLTKANVPGNSNRPFYVFFFFPTFLRLSQRKSVDSAGKSAFSKIVTFESDLLTTNKDIAPQKSPNFRDVCMVGGGGHKLAPLPTPTIETSVNFCHFAELYLRLLETCHWQLGKFTNIKTVFPVSKDFPWMVHEKLEKPWKGLFPEVSGWRERRTPSRGKVESISLRLSINHLSDLYLNMQLLPFANLPNYRPGQWHRENLETRPLHYYPFTSYEDALAGIARLRQRCGDACVNFVIRINPENPISPLIQSMQNCSVIFG